MADGYTPPGQRSYAETEEQRIESIQDEEQRKEEARESDFVEVDDEGDINEDPPGSSSEPEETGNTDSDDASEVSEDQSTDSKVEQLKDRVSYLKENASGNARLQRTKQRLSELESEARDKAGEVRNQVENEIRNELEGDEEKRYAQEQVFGSLAPDQSGGETLLDRQELIQAQSRDGGLPDDKESLEDLERFVEDNPSAQNDFNNVEDAIETKRKAVEREEQVDQALDDLQDAPTREERLENINQRLRNAEEREETENIELDTSELEEQKERLENAEGLYVIQEDGEEQVVSKNELEEELQQQKQDLQDNQEEIDEAFKLSNTTRTVSREERVEEKSEEVDLQEDFVETDSAYTEAGNTIIEAGKTGVAFGETFLSSRGTDLVTSVIPGGDSPTEVVEDNIAEDLISERQDPTERAIDRLSSPPGMLIGFAGVGAGATKGIQAVSRVSSTAGKALGGAVAGLEALEITRRGFDAGREFGQGDVEEGFEPLVKLGVEEAGARAGARAVTSSGTTSTSRAFRRTDPSGNQVAEDNFPTSDQLPRTGQNLEFEVRNTEDVIPTREDIAGTRDLEVLQAGNRREVPQETSQVQGERSRISDGLDDRAEPLQRGGEEDVFGSREDRVGLREENDEELLSLNEEARSQTDLETRETASTGNQGRTESEDPQIGNSDVVNEEGFTPEEAEVLAEQEQAVGVSGVSETGGLELQVQTVDDLGTLQRVDFSEIASDLAPQGSRKGQLQLTQQQETPAERFDITEDIELVGDAEEPDFEVSASGENFQVTRLDQASEEEVEALGVAPFEQETETETVVEPDTDADIEIESEIVQSEFNDTGEAEVSVVENISEEENLNEERPVVSGVSEDVSSSVGQGNEVGFREETGKVQDIREEIVPQEEVVEEEIPVGRQVNRSVFEEVREIRQETGRFDSPGRNRPEGREGRAGFDFGNEFEDDFDLDQGENLPGETEEDEEFLPDLLSANTSELLFGSATFDVTDEETATGRQFTVEQQENLEETENNFEVRF